MLRDQTRQARPLLLGRPPRRTAKNTSIDPGRALVYSTRTSSGRLASVRSGALAHGGTVGVSCTAGLTAFWLKLRAAS